MKIIKNIQVSFLVISLMLLSVYNSNAAKEKTNVRITANNINPFQVIEIKDNKFDYMENNSSWTNEFTNYKIKNNLVLGFDEEYVDNQAPQSNVTIEFQVKYYTYNTGSHSFDPHIVSPNPILTVNYSELQAFKNRSVYTYEGGLKMEVTILTITSSTGSVPQNLIVETEIETERYYSLNYSSQINTVNSIYDNTTGELVINWALVQGAEEYDLEWTFVNNFNASGGANSDVSIPETTEKLFKYNSTRVTTLSNEYRIPLLYEQGFILYRVRAVGKTGVDFKNRVYTHWSSHPDLFVSVSTFGDYYTITGHEKDLNWQMSINYAEEGKNKASISYFDGSLRNRQSVTKSNTDNNVIVGELIYDYQGRKAIQVLPTPTNESSIKYFDYFNQNLGLLPYTRNNFDLDAISNSCNTITDPMIKTEGSSKYYSENNNVGGINRDYIPDANQYPFSQIEYTPDNTGRVSRESGVGETHRLGNGHETKYYYGKPDQYELDQLFGSEVGYANHYKKNMVVDANGQISLTYTDLQGKTIATTLIGKVPDNLEQLDSNYIDNLVVDLFNKVNAADFTGPENQYLPEVGANLYSRELLVATDGPRKYTYEMRGNKYDIGCNTPICYDCIYDLLISLTNECNDEELLSDQVNNEILDITIGTPTISCSSTPPSFHSNSISNPWTSLPLGIGSHSLNKRLSVNMDALALYTNHYLDPLNNPCIYSYSYFLNQAMEDIDSSICAMTCAECLTDLGAYDQYNPDLPNATCDPCYTYEEYLELMAECNKYCDEGSIECQSKLDLMLIDVSPMGQYGGVVVTDNDNAFPSSDVYSLENQSSLIGEVYIDPSYFPLSVFNEDNKLPLKEVFQDEEPVFGEVLLPNWRFPYNPDIPATDEERFRYLNDDNTISKIILNDIDGTYYPEIQPGSPTETDADGLTTVLPQYLLNIEDFIYYWQANWANSLVFYHPEYPLYKHCTDLSESHDFDWKWNSVFVFDDLNSSEDALGYFFSGVNSSYYTGSKPNPLGTGISNALDPYFNSTKNPYLDPNDWINMNNEMINYYEVGDVPGHFYSIWNVANIMANCPDGNCAAFIATCYNDVTINTDEEWMYFKSFYESLKQKYYYKQQTRYSIEHACYNGCIGEDPFNPYQDGFYNWPYNLTQPEHTAQVIDWNFITPSRIPPFVTLPGYITLPPGYDPPQRQFSNYEQPCNVLTNTYYKEKIKRFPRPEDELPLPMPGQTVQDYVSTQQNSADAAVFSYCGQCPVARDLQFFLNAMADELLTNVDLNCSNGGVPEFVPDLQSAMFSTNAPTVWNLVSSNSNDVVVSITSGSNSPCSLYLHSQPGIIWDNITGFCCLEGIVNPLYLTQLPGMYYFNITANMSDNSQVVLEGASCLLLSGCDLDYLCNTTPLGADIQNMFNALLYSQDAVNNLPALNSVFTYNPVPFNAAPLNSAITNNMIQASGMSSNINSWQWHPVVPGTFNGSMSATLTDGSLTCGINLSFVENTTTYQWDDIISFLNIRPDQAHLTLNGSNSYTTKYFLITALVNDNGVLKYVQLEGNSTCFEIGTCTEAEFVGTNN